MSELPEGWAWSNLGDVCRKPQYGWTTKSGADADGLPYLRTTDITHGPIDWAKVPRCHDNPPDPSAFLLEDGDIVVSRAGSVGSSALVRSPPPAVFASYLIRLHVSPLVSAAYLSHFMRSQAYWRQISEVKVGIAVQNVNAKKLAAIALPVPPRGEQERIVAAIEEHLSRLDDAQASLAAARTRVSKFRSSSIEECTRGSWKPTPLGDVLVSLRNGCFVSRPKVDPPGLPILRISAVRPLALDATDVRYAPGELERADEYRVRAGEVLFTRYSGNPDFVGACAVVPPAGAGLLHPDKLIRGVPRNEVVLGEWIALVMASGSGRREVEQRLKTTAGQVGISGSQLRTVPIPLPPLSEQAERIESWHARADAASRILAELKAAESRAAGLRRSLLAAAFAGQLVPQDPDDEPAPVLLERIATERAAAPPGIWKRKVTAS